MTEQERWDFLLALDQELLLGGVCLSEWCSRIVYEADVAFVGGAHLAAILTAVAGIETYLRSENQHVRNASLASLIDSFPFECELRNDLHKLRRYRNRWVHVECPWQDDRLLKCPGEIDGELFEMALFAVKVLRKTIYSMPWI